MDRLPLRLYDERCVISDCGQYRYWLTRDFGLGRFPVAFIMLNPSTADGYQDDQTILKCIRYAKKWGAYSLIVVNLFALRSTKPEKLWADGVTDPVGPLNDDAIRYAVDYACGNGGFAVCAWGNNGAYMDRGDTVRGWHFGKPLRYLKLNGGGQPAHPLYLRGDLEPMEFKRPPTVEPSE